MVPLEPRVNLTALDMVLLEPEIIRNNYSGLRYGSTRTIPAESYFSPFLDFYLKFQVKYSFAWTENRFIEKFHHF